jgi:hypothetical protein
MSWPSDADGDVFRRLESNGFDFSKSYAVDYNVDFDSWPPHPAAVDLLRSEYGNIEANESDDGEAGYVQFRIIGPVTYEGVTSVQRRVTSTLQAYGGVCESWGVFSR